MTPQEYNENIKTRARVTLSITMEVDSSERSTGNILAKALEKVGYALSVQDLTDWYSYDGVFPLSIDMKGEVKQLATGPKLSVPEEVEAE